jgi:hypothetical protein
MLLYGGIKYPNCRVRQPKTEDCTTLPIIAVIAAARNSFAIPLFMGFKFVVRETWMSSRLKSFQERVARSTIGIFAQMSRLWHRIVFVAVSLFVSCAPVQETDQLQAEAVAKSWIGLVDAGQYDKAYEEYPARIKVSETKEEFLERMRRRRAPLGLVVSRSLISAFAHQLQGAPAGNCELLVYRSSFAGKFSATEHVVVTRESGTWQVSSYRIK